MIAASENSVAAADASIQRICSFEGR
jgi:hypothetical protein